MADEHMAGEDEPLDLATLSDDDDKTSASDEDK
jgi:hypothetical protein